MLISEGEKDAWEELNVCPVSLTYEWDPCDAFKVRELLITKRDGEYIKSPGEDETSMALGMTGNKGAIHLHFCNKIPWSEDEGVRTDKHLASKVDEAIFRGYKVFPNQVLSAKKLGFKFPDEAVEVTQSDRDKFEERLNSIVEFVGEDFSREEIERKWCEITVQPLLAKHKF